MLRSRSPTSDLPTASPAAHIGPLITNNNRSTVKASVFAATQPGGCCCHTWPACWAGGPSSLVRPTSDRSASTSALRASSWCRDTAERKEELIATSVSRTTGQDGLPSPALCLLPASKPTLTGPMRPTEGLRWQHGWPGFLRQSEGGWLLSFPPERL